MSDAVNKAAEVVKDTVAPAVKSIGTKATASAGFVFGSALSVGVGLVAAAVTVVAAEHLGKNVAHAVATKGQVWNASRFLPVE